MDAQELATTLTRECPTWAAGTIVLKDQGDQIVGYGYLERKGEESAEVTIASSPEGVRFLSASLPAEGE
jgi:hypothetical protein